MQDGTKVKIKSGGFRDKIGVLMDTPSNPAAIVQVIMDGTRDRIFTRFNDLEEVNDDSDSHRQ